MAFTFNGTNQYLNTTSPPVTVVPLTLVCWFSANDVTSTRTLLDLTTSFGANGFRLLIAGAITGDPVYADYLINTGTNAQTTSGYTANTWNHAAATFPNNTTVTAYLNGGSSATSIGAALNPTPTRICVGARFSSSAPGLYMDGQIAEVGIWNAALTAAEIASLAKGMTCDKVRPQSLVFYAPLVRDLTDQKGRLTITNNNAATVANHPRVYA
jgi:hypothetical protein